jgi:hypothetical protein
LIMSAVTPRATQHRHAAVSVEQRSQLIQSFICRRHGRPGWQADLVETTHSVDQDGNQPARDEDANDEVTDQPEVFTRLVYEIPEASLETELA